MRPPEMCGLDDLAGLETVRAQLEEWLDVVRAERASVNLGMQIARPTWKNLVFTGGPGTGKSWAARALAVAYRELGFVEGGQALEAAAAGMAGTLGPGNVHLSRRARQLPSRPSRQPARHGSR